MKTHDVQRGVTSRPNREVVTSALNLGRVVRLRDTEIPGADPRFRKRGGSTHPARREAVLIWSAALSVITLIVMGLAVSFWLLPNLSRSPADAAGLPINYDSLVRVASKFPSPSREQALAAVKRALANREPDRLESFFRMGAASRAEVLDFLNNSDQRDGLVDRYEWLSSMDVDGLLMEGVLVIYQGKDRPVERLAFLTPDAAGVWKVDFDAFARTVKPSWHALLEKRAEQAVLRVFVGKDVYYNGPFSDEQQWVCYGIASPDTEELLRGYCKVGSPLAAAMDKLFADGEKLSRATVEVRRVEDGGARQFEITRLLARDWVVAGSPDSGS